MLVLAWCVAAATVDVVGEIHEELNAEVPGSAELPEDRAALDVRAVALDAREVKQSKARKAVISQGEQAYRPAKEADEVREGVSAAPSASIVSASVGARGLVDVNSSSAQALREQPLLAVSAETGAVQVTITGLEPDRFRVVLPGATPGDEPADKVDWTSAVEASSLVEVKAPDVKRARSLAHAAVVMDVVQSHTAQATAAEPAESVEPPLAKPAQKKGARSLAQATVAKVDVVQAVAKPPAEPAESVETPLASAQKKGARSLAQATVAKVDVVQAVEKPSAVEPVLAVQPDVPKKGARSLARPPAGKIDVVQVVSA